MLNPAPDPSLHGALSGGRPTRQLLALALVMLVIAAATILGALGFQYIGGYEPCMLCLMQRTPYYAGIPLVAAAGIAVWLKAPRWLIALLFAVFGLLFIYETGLAVYHSGVEWSFWEGPASCSQALAGAHGAAAMLSQLDAVTPASCTQAVWRFLGLSFAGWNVPISALLALLGLHAARPAWQKA